MEIDQPNKTGANVTPRKRALSNSILRSSMEQSVVKDELPSRPTNPLVSPLLTDMYQITMAYAYWKNGKHEEHAVFDLFFRENPFKGEYTVFAGLEEVIRFVSNFRVTDEEIEYLRLTLPPTVHPDFFSWLRNVDCTKLKLYAIPEGTVVFPRVPLIRVEGPIAVAQLLETTLLTLVNYPSLVATNAARHRRAAGDDKQLLEFGLRRAQGVDGGISASRYSYLGGFDGTSNVLAAKLFGIPCRGTQAHAYIEAYTDEEQLRDSTLVDKNTGKSIDFLALVKQCQSELGFTNTNSGELIAFTSYATAFPNGFLALVDTYDTLKSGLLNFLSVALALHRAGYRPIGIRLDSGDIAYLSQQCRKLFKEVSEKVKVPNFATLNITASNDLNEATILSLNQQHHQVDSFGVGTNLVTCQAQPALGCVYKLVEINGVPRIKISQEVSKVTIPALKDAYRLYGSQPFPIIDLMILSKEEQPPKVGEKILCLHPFDPKKRAFVTPTNVVKLHQIYWDCGKVTETIPSLEEVRSYVMKQLAGMRTDHLRPLNPTPYKVSVTNKLYNLIQDLWLQGVPIPDISFNE